MGFQAERDCAPLAAGKRLLQDAAVCFCTSWKAGKACEALESLSILRDSSAGVTPCIGDVVCRLIGHSIARDLFGFAAFSRRH